MWKIYIIVYYSRFRKANIRRSAKKGEIGYMLQTDSLLPWRTIYKNVLFGLEIRKIKTLENEKYAQNY